MQYEERELSRLEREFLKFNRENPEVYDLIVKFTREWLSQTSKRKLGIARVYERIRWEVDLTTFRGKQQTFKLPNNHRAFYARLIMHQEPDLSGVFNVKRQRTSSFSTRDVL